MDRRTTLTKTAKGLMEATGKTGFLSRDLRNILKEIEGKIRVSTLVEKLDSIDEPDLMESLAKLEKDGFIQEFTPHEEVGPATRPGVRVPTPPASAPADGGEDLDFSSIPPPPPSKPISEPRTTGRGESSASSARAPASPPARPAAAKEPPDSVIGAEERIRAQLAAARAKRESAGLAAAPAKAPEVPKEVEDKIRREVEEKLRNEATQRRVREENERQKREADEKARREKEEAARAERAKADEFAKLQASLGVISQPDERAEREAKERESREREKREADERTRRESEEKARAEAEARRKKEEEERARKARQKAQEEAELRERAEAEEREQREADERTRREAEEEQRRWKEAEKKAKEEAKARAKAEAEAAAQARREERERERIEREEFKRAEAEEKERRKETAEREKAVSAVRTSGRGAARAPRSGGRPIALVLFLLLIGAVVALLFIPIDPAPYEKNAQDWFGQPVKIGSVGISLTPSPALKFDNVTIGTEPQMRISGLRAVPELGSLLGDRMALKSVEFENATVPRQFLVAALSVKRPGGSLRIGRIVANRLKLNVSGIALPPLDLEATLGADGELKSATLSNSDLRLTVNLVPKGDRAEIDFTSTGAFSLPIGSGLSLDGFTAKGSITATELVLTQFNGGALDGYLRGNARMRWSDGWSLDGEAAASQMDVATIAPTLVSNGRIEAKGVYSMRAQTAEKLFDSLKLDGTFSVQKGSISAFDMTRVMQGDRIGGGSTLFSEMTGGVIVDGGRVQLRQLRIVAGLMNANSVLDMDANKNLSGRVHAELRAQTTQARTTLIISGTLKAPQFRRGN